MERRGRKRHARRDRAGHAGRVEGRAARRHELPGAEGNSGYASLRGHGGGRCATVASVLPAATVSRRPVRLERRAGRVAGLAIRAPTRANDRAADDRGPAADPVPRGGVPLAGSGHRRGAAPAVRDSTVRRRGGPGSRGLAGGRDGRRPPALHDHGDQPHARAGRRPDRADDAPGVDDAPAGQPVVRARRRIEEPVHHARAPGVAPARRIRAQGRRARRGPRPERWGARTHRLPAYPAARGRPRHDGRAPRGAYRAAGAGTRRLRAGRVPEALQAGGVPIELLGPDTLARGDLSRYGAIVIGSRAYETEPALVASNGRLLDYARAGGLVIVQYQQYPFVNGGFAPHRLSIARPHDRVTDETAAVTVLDSASPVFHVPNEIGPDDWRGWVQERGLDFAHDWDPAYTKPVEMHEPGEPPLQGGLLVAAVGKGTYVYTGLSFFRQLPAGVPGAYRLFANLLALGKK